MDIRAASAIVNTTDLSRWCEERAQEIDELHAAAANRPLSPQEQQHVLDVHRQLLRRVSAHASLVTTIYEPEARMSPIPPPVPPMVAPRVGWLRRWLRKVVG